MEADAAIDPGMEDAPPPAASVRKKLRLAPPGIKREADSEDDDETGHEGSERRRSARCDKSRGSPPIPRHALLAPYDERMLRRRLDACPLALAVTPQARRLRRKLLVRQAKRQQGLPLLDIDRALSLAGGVYGAREAATAGGGRCGAGRDLRVLDRFQVRAAARRSVEGRLPRLCQTPRLAPLLRR